MTVPSQRQSWNADDYARNARFVSDLGADVVALLDPRPGERILDLGCGDGALTEKLATQGADVTGVDASESQIAAARARGLDAHVATGEALDYDREFDAVFSNAALHWMTDPDAVVAGVARALRPGGRFVGEFGGHTNVAACLTALVAALNRRGYDGQAAIPWYFPTPEEYTEVLRAHGFHVEDAKLIPRPTPLPTGISGWMETFGESFFSVLPEDERDAMKHEVIELLRPSLCDASGQWTADYVRLRFRAKLPG
jgi:trans-aconitate methyltransferase